MQKLLIALLTVLALAGLPTWGQAQTAITTTTITEAVTSTAGGISITLNSATGISDGVYLLIDNELMRVQRSWTSGVVVPVERGPRPTTHADNSVVHIFPIGAVLSRFPQGSCTRGEGEAVYALSVIAPYGAMARCGFGAYPAGTNGWHITDISGNYGVASNTPPQTR